MRGVIAEMGMPPRHTLSENLELMKEWDYAKNDELGLFPDQLGISSKKVVWWICSNNHSYDMDIAHKSGRGDGCPICSGRRIVPGINDFQTKCPEIAAEWNYDKNGDIKPNQISYKSGNKYWWICKYGHEWQATPHDRVGDHTGCPECKKRRFSSFGEQAVYFYVKQLCPDAQNRYKELFNHSMELDIYIPSRKIGIEFDGGNWHKSEEEHKREKRKYDRCRKNGITLIRIKENSKTKWEDVADWIYYIDRKRDYDMLSKVIQSIIDSIDPESNMWTRKTFGHYHSSVTVNLLRDENTIREYLAPIDNSLVDLRPDLIQDWDYERNGNLRPEMFGINSNEPANWKCHVCGHRWRTTIIHRAGKRRSGCPECSKIRQGRTFTKRVAERVGSLRLTHPLLAEQWHPTKNGDLTPDDMTAGHFGKVWWLCPKCSYEWEASPNSRKNGIGCPHCSGRAAMKGVDDLKTLNQKLAAEWNYVKNGELRPEDFKPGSGKKVWWICPKCSYEWRAVIADRNKGTICPKCVKKINGMKGAQKVMCIETGVIYQSIAEAAENNGLTKAQIGNCIHGRQKQAGGMHWAKG